MNTHDYDKGYDAGWVDAWDRLENDVAKALGISDKSAEEGKDFIKIVEATGRRLRYLEQQIRKLRTQ